MANEKDKKKITMSEEEWAQKLTPQEFHVLREKGTELPFSGEHATAKKKGRYLCAGCGNELFSSETKFDSGSGWPSFWAPVSEDNLETKSDRSLWMKRTEALCGRCGGHLGHVFKDGPKPTGLRYCINSVALKFDGDEEK